MKMKHNVQDADSHFIFNPATRNWTYRPTKKRVLIQGDHNSEVFTFEFPRLIEGHDMSKCDAVQVHYINIDEVTREQSCGVFEVDDVQALSDDDDTLTCSWLISNNATKYRGGLNFLLRFACFREDGSLYYDWHSAIFSGVAVAKGINNGDVIVAEYPDILAQWRQDIDRLEAVDWMATKEVIHEGSVVLADLTRTFGGAPTIVSGLQMKIDPGIYYDVTWNGKIYSCQALVYDDETYLGNARLAFGSLASALPDTGEPFGIVYTGGTSIMLTKANSATETITLSISTQTVVKYNKLPVEYLPDNIGGSANIDVTAEVGQTIVVKSVDENGKPTEWAAAYIVGAVASSVEPMEDDIPKVFFCGALQQTKDEAVVPFRYISKTEDISGYAEIKAQGNSSMSYPKKNQTVKLFKDAECTEKLKVDFKGWGKQNKFCFKANWIDLTHARNVVSARLWADVVKSRANYAELPELLRTTPNQGAMDGFPIKVYANGVYQGRYTLNIPKDKWAFNMDDDLDNHCVLCGENYASGCFRAAANINESDWTDEIHDTVPTSIKTRWNEVISFVMNSTDNDFKANLGNYFDVDSLIDYHLFGLASCGFDAYGKNQLYLTYDGQKWIASMYDMDATWGLYWNGSKLVATDYPRTSYEDFVSTQSSGEGNLLYIRLEQLFYEELQARWAELRNDVLTIDNVINRFERFTDIASADLVKEDYASTTGGGKFTGIPSQSTNNIQQIRAYAIARLAWTDEYVATLSGSEVEPDEPEEPVVPDEPENVPCTGLTLSASTLTFTGEGSQTLVATVEPENTTDIVEWSVDYSSIASVADGVVTARANGSCTITARCGEYSATCAVSVSGIEVEEQVNVLYENYSPAGASFSKTAVMDWENGYIEASIDLANCTGANECILTVGTNVATWNPYNIHTNYTATTNRFEVSFVHESLTVARYRTTLESTEILLRIDKNGLSINGTLLTEDDYNVNNATEAYGKLLNLLVRNNRIEVGSAEGNTRSNATYHYIKVVGFGNGNVIYAPEWSDVAQFGLVRSTGLVKVTGDAYYSGGYLAIPDNATSVSLSNINGATYTWKEMVVYDEHFTYMTESETNASTAPTTINLATLSGAKYIRATAYPNGIETNNDPNNQLEITFA